MLFGYYLNFDTNNVILGSGDLKPKTGELCKQPWRFVVYDACFPGLYKIYPAHFKDDNILHGCDAKMFKSILKTANHLLGTKIPIMKVCLWYSWI